MTEPTPSPSSSPPAEADGRSAAEEAADPAPSMTLNTLGPRLLPSQSEGALPAMPSSAVGTSTSGGQRFHVLRPHARGGLGEVFVAYDEELHREVALKEIPLGHARYEEIRARFLLEAEITGSLEHPGVVPVYSLGRHSDGRPFYAMRFIRGRSLREAIDRFHRKESVRRDAGERALALRNLLSRFVEVCNTIAYAHSRGVLHRDVKPANIMLGSYGETLVVDWGLAKAINPKEEDWTLPLSEFDYRPPAVMAIHSFATQVGATLGTPVFMSPEQAKGPATEIGPASDIYSLGATLYMLLTGHAPFGDAEARTVLEKVARGDWLPPRQVNKTVPPPLDAICRKAMALRPEDRYRSALELAADIEHWLADEPVSAYREPWTTRWGRWMRRHRTAVASATATVLAVVLLGSGTAVLLERQRVERQVERDRQEARHRRGVEAALDEVSRLQQTAHWTEARVALEQAENQLREGGATDLQGRVEQARRDLELVVKLDAIRLKRATLVGGKFDWETASREYAAAFREAGLGEAGDDPTEAAAWVAHSAVRGTLVAALDDWAGCATERPKRAWVLEVARRADPDPFRDRLRDPAVLDDAAALERLAGDPRMATLSPHLSVMLAIKQMEFGNKPKQGFNKFADERSIQARKPTVLQRNAEQLLRTAWERHPEDFWTNLALGNALWRVGKPDAAAGYFRAALALRPGTSRVHHDLGAALQEVGRIPEAIAELQKAIALDPKDAHSHYNLGTTLHKTGRLREAIAEYRTSIALVPKYASAHVNLGAALKAAGQPQEAIVEFQRAVAIDSTASGPHNNLGVVLKESNRLSEAIAEFHKAIELDSTNANAHNNLGLALQDQDRIEEAIAEHQKAISLNPKDASAYNNLGNALRDLGRYSEAIAAFHKALDLNPKIALIHVNLGQALNNMGRFPEAIAEFHKAIDLDPKRADAHGYLGTALFGQCKFAEANQAIQRCMTLLPADHPTRKVCSGMLKYHEEMLALDAKLPLYLKGEDRPTDDSTRVNLGVLCIQRNHPAAAVRFYEEAFAVQPRLADNLHPDHRYNAVRAAALAAAGRGTQAAQLDDKERARLRKRALDWLRADLVQWAKSAEGGAPAVRAEVRKNLRNWQTDADLAGLRDAPAVANLPESERAACQKLWRDVAELLKKCGG